MNALDARPAAEGGTVWLAVLGACICMFCGQPPVAMYTFGVFVPEVANATGWPAPAVASAIGPGALIAALVAPLIGGACDRFGTRTVALIGGPAFGIGLALVGLAPQSATTFVMFTVAMWLLSFAASPVPYAQMVTGLVKERRGLALSIMFAFGALGIAAWPPYAAYLIGAFGWRAAYVGLGLTAGTGIFVAALFMLKNAPRVTTMTAAGTGSTVREAIRTPQFWKIAVVFMILTGVLAGTAVNLPVMLRKQGMDAQTASLVMTIVGISMLVGRLALGPLLDRWFSPYVTIGSVLLPIAGFLLLFTNNGQATIFGAAVLLGFGLGSEFNAAAYIVGRAFGFRAFGAIYGLVTLCYGLGGASGPALVGIGLARDLPQQMIFAFCLGLLLLAIAILATMKKSELPF